MIDTESNKRVEEKNRAREMALLAARTASSKQASDIVILDVAPLIGITDFFVICSGSSERQVSTIVEEIARQLKDEAVKPYRTEGASEARWVLIDCLDVVIHVFHAEERDFYDLERLWKDAASIRFEEASAEEA